MYICIQRYYNTLLIFPGFLENSNYIHIYLYAECVDIYSVYTDNLFVTLHLVASANVVVVNW